MVLPSRTAPTLCRSSWIECQACGGVFRDLAIAGRGELLLRCNRPLESDRRNRCRTWNHVEFLGAGGASVEAVTEDGRKAILARLERPLRKLRVPGLKVSAAQ